MATFRQTRQAIQGGAKGAKTGWSTHPNQRNAKTGVKTTQPTRQGFKNKVGSKGY